MDNDPGLAPPAVSAFSRRFYALFPALTQHNYRLFIYGQSISLVGTWMQGPVLSWVVYDLTNSKEALGLVNFLGQLPMAMLVIIAGVVADRRSRQAIITMTQSLLLLSALGLAILASTHHLTIGWIYFFAVLSGVAQAFDTPARQAFMVEMAGREHLGNAIALNSAMFNTARVVGPTIGGAVFAAVGAALCFFINSASFLAIILALFAMKGLYRRPTEPGKNVATDFIDGLRYVASHGDIRVVMLLTAVFSLFGGYYTTLLPAFARDIYGKEATAYGILASAVGIGALPSALITAVTTKARRQERWMVYGLVLMCAMLFGLAFTTNYVVAYALYAVYGFGMVAFLVSGNILVQHLSDARYQGRTMGVRHFVFGGMGTFGALIAGYLSHFIGLRWTVASGTAATVIVLALLAPRILKVDILSTPAAPNGSGP